MIVKYKSLINENAPKIRPIIAILFTTLISSLLLWLHGQPSTGHFRTVILTYPATISFVKQLIASLLGAFWVYVVSSIFNLTTRLRLVSDQEVTLQTLNVWVALGLQRIDFTLPFYYTAVTVIVVLVGHGIGAVWAGAISPLPTIVQLESCTIFTPDFTGREPWSGIESSSQTHNSSKDGDDGCRTWNGVDGFIPTCPVPGTLECQLKPSFPTELTLV